jgi:hypothetical protein
MIIGVQNVATDYDSVELRLGRLHKIRRSEARMLSEEDHMVPVAKCYCRSHDVLWAADAELQKPATESNPSAAARVTNRGCKKRRSLVFSCAEKCAKKTNFVIHSNVLLRVAW